LINSKMF